MRHLDNRVATSAQAVEIAGARPGPVLARCGGMQRSWLIALLLSACAIDTTADDADDDYGWAADDKADGASDPRQKASAEGRIVIVNR